MGKNLLKHFTHTDTKVRERESEIFTETARLHHAYSREHSIQLAQH